MDILSFEVRYTSIFRYKRKNVLFLHIPYSILNSKYTDSNTATIYFINTLKIFPTSLSTLAVGSNEMLLSEYHNYT